MINHKMQITSELQLRTLFIVRYVDSRLHGAVAE